MLERTASEFASNGQRESSPNHEPRENDHKTTFDQTKDGGVEARQTPMETATYSPPPDEQTKRIAPGVANAKNQTSTHRLVVPFGEPGQAARKSRLRSIQEVREMNVRPRQWIGPELKGILFEGFTLLAGPQEVGKSFLALNTVLYLAEHQPNASFVYMALDDGCRRLTPRLNKLLAGRPSPPNVKIVSQSDNWPRMAWPTVEGDGLQELIAELRELPDPRLVVIDTLSLFMPPSKRSLSYDEEYAQMAEIRKVTEMFPNLSILAITHINKGEYRDQFDSIYGTRGKGAASDVQMVMLREQAQGRATMKIRGNDLAECISTLAWDAKELRWGLEATTAEGEEGYEAANQQFQASAQRPAENVNKPKRPGPKPAKVEAARTTAVELLANGPMPPDAFERAMSERGHTDYATRKARESLGIRCVHGHYRIPPL